MQFRSPEHALRWVYETSNTPIVKISSVNKMRGPQRASGEEITAHDRHAQAALIIAMCERVLSPVHMAYVQVQFGRDATGFDLLVRQVSASLGTGVHSRRGIESIIRSYCGENGIGIREIKRHMQCGQLKAVSYRNSGYDVLDAIHAQAMDRIWREMEKAGLSMDSFKITA